MGIRGGKREKITFKDLILFILLYCSLGFMLSYGAVQWIRLLYLIESKN